MWRYCRRIASVAATRTAAVGMGNLVPLLCSASLSTTLCHAGFSRHLSVHSHIHIHRAAVSTAAPQDGAVHIIGDRLSRVLTERQRALLNREKSLLLRCSSELKRSFVQDVDVEKDAGLLAECAAGLDELFLVTFVGEFNAGKSAVINALVGEAWCAEGVLPTTSLIKILRYGDSQQPRQQRKHGQVSQKSQEYVAEEYVDEHTRSVRLPVPWLRHTNVVDTPGTNAIFEGHTQITEDFIPRSDLVVFVTSGMQPFSESERSFLRHVIEWRRRVIFVVNKMDLLPDADERKQVLDFVASNVGRALGGDRPNVFAASSRRALALKLRANSLRRKIQEDGSASAPSSTSSQSPSSLSSPDAELKTVEAEYEETGFHELEQYIMDTLNNSASKVALKLSNPLSVTLRVLGKYVDAASRREMQIRGDTQTLDWVEAEIAAHSAEVMNDHESHCAKIDNVLLTMQADSDKFIDHELVLSSVLKLITSSGAKRFQYKFNMQVTRHVNEEIDRFIGDLIAWLQQRGFKHTKHVLEYVKQNPNADLEILRSDPIAGSRQIVSMRQRKTKVLQCLSVDFDANRQRLIDDLHKISRRIMDDKSRMDQSERIRGSVRSAMIQTSAVQLGAMGIGVLFSVAAFDWTGIAGAGVLAVTGLSILPYRRKQLKREVREWTSQLRKELLRVVTRYVREEVESSREGLQSALQPYRRFVNNEKRDVCKQKDILKALIVEVQDMQDEIRAGAKSEEESGKGTTSSPEKRRHGSVPALPCTSGSSDTHNTH